MFNDLLFIKARNYNREEKFCWADFLMDAPDLIASHAYLVQPQGSLCAKNNERLIRHCPDARCLERDLPSQRGVPAMKIDRSRLCSQANRRLARLAALELVALPSSR